MCDEQGGNEKGETQIEVTPEMVEAGLRVYMDAHPDTAWGCDPERDIVRAIFESMDAARSSLGQTAQDR